ncbi:gag-pol polyprotein [Tanacetum coccineum]
MSNSNTNLQTQTSSVLQNDTVSSCSISNIQEKTQLSRSRCMHSLKEIKSLFKFLSETLQDYGTMPIFKRTFSQDLDLLEQHLTKDILSRTDCTTTLTNLITKFENAFNSEFEEHMRKYTRYNAQSFNDAMICTMDSIRKYMLEIILHQQRTLHLLKQKTLMQTQEDHSNQTQALNSDSLKVDLVVKQNSCSEKEDRNSETASNKSPKECSLNSKTQDVHAIKYKMSKAKERCMAYFRSLHSHLQVLSKDDLKGTRIEHGFKRAFMSLFGQDVDTFTRTMLLNVDQLQKQLDKDEFQEDGSMTAFWVVNNQFQKFIDSKFTLDYDSQMTDTYFVEYTGIEVQHFRDTLLQHLGNVKKSVAERTRHQRQYERRVNKRQMQTQESKIDTGKALDADLVDTESIRTDSTVQDDNSRSGNDTDADDADIRPIPVYDEEPKGVSPMLDSSPDNQTTEYSKQSLESENILLKKTVAQFQKDFSRMEAHCIALELKYQNQALKSGQHGQILNETCNKAKIEKEIDEKVFAIAALKNDLRKLKGNSVDTKFDKTSVLGKPVLPSLRNQSAIRQLNAFKSERAQMSKQQFASQVDVNKNLSKPVTQHYLPKKTESAFAKLDHMIASSSSRNSSKNMPRFSSNDMVHNHYLDVAKKKTQERDRNSKSSVMPTARFQSTADDSKPKPRNNNQTPRSLPVSKSSCVTITVVPNADHSMSSSSFSDSKNFVCSTCHKCVFNANHDACITKLLKEVNSRAKIQFHKTRNNNKPVDQKSHTQKPASPRSDLRWKPTGRIFKSIGLRWIPTGMLFDSCTSKDTQPNITKFEPKSLKCVFLGYSHIQKGYRCYSPQLHRYLVSRDVTFHEDLPYFPVITYRHQEENDDLLVYVSPTFVETTKQSAELDGDGLSLKVYARRTRITSDLVREPSTQLKDAPIDAPNDVSNDVPISAPSEAYGKSDAPSDAPSGFDLPPPSPAPELDLPIALQKGKRTCKYLVSAFVSYDGLSTSSCAFVANLDSILVPKTVGEALAHYG